MDIERIALVNGANGMLPPGTNQGSGLSSVIAATPTLRLTYDVGLRMVRVQNDAPTGFLDYYVPVDVIARIHVKPERVAEKPKAVAR